MAAATVMGGIGFGRFAYTAIMPSMQEALGLSNTQTGLLATWNAVGYMVAALFAGVLASRFGPRVVVSVSAAVVGAAMVLTGFVEDFTLAFLLRAITGMGSAGIFVPVMGLLSAWFAPSRRGRATGVAVSGGSLGLAATGLLVPALIAAYGSLGWRVSWWLLGAITLVLALLAYLLLRNHPDEKDLAPFGQPASHEPADNGKPDASPLAWGLVYRSGALWRLSLVYFAFGFSSFLYATYFVKYLAKEGGFSQTEAGHLWALVGIVAIASSFAWGMISDRRGRRFSLFWVLGLMAVSFLTFALSRTASGYYLSTLIYALTSQSVPGIMAAACGDYLGARLAPAALGLITFVLGIGLVLGPGVAGYLADLTGSLSPAFALAAVVAGAGALGALLLRPPAHTEEALPPVMAGE